MEQCQSLARWHHRNIALPRGDTGRVYATGSQELLNGCGVLFCLVEVGRIKEGKDLRLNVPRAQD